MLLKDLNVISNRISNISLEGIVIYLKYKDIFLPDVLVFTKFDENMPMPSVLHIHIYLV